MHLRLLPGGHRGDQLGAGTVPYLDPFLGPPRRPRYDAAAERFAAAVTLYEMATGTLPRWGDDANPAAIEDEVTLDPSLFDPSVADRLVAFFAKALARDASDRFDTVEEMAEAWRQIFVAIPPDPGRHAAGGGRAHRWPRRWRRPTLTARARSALERLGVHTVGELLDYEPSALTRARGVPDATRKEILAAGARAAPAAEPGGPPSRHRTATSRSPRASRRSATRCCAGIKPGKERAAVEVLLGFARHPRRRVPAAGRRRRRRPRRPASPSRSCRSGCASTHSNGWPNPALAQVRDEIVALLDTRGGGDERRGAGRGADRRPRLVHQRAGPAAAGDRPGARGGGGRAGPRR